MVVTTDGEEKPISDLAEAVNVAIGSGGSIVLRNGDPLRLSADKQPILLFTKGWLTIRAGEGTHPVLIVDLKGTNPLLNAGATMVLTLEGLTIVTTTTIPPPGRARPPSSRLRARPTQPLHLQGATGLPPAGGRGYSDGAT